MGQYLLCGHPDGIFRSSDMGKTWNMVHPSVTKTEYKSGIALFTNSIRIPGDVFTLYVSGNVLYAVDVENNPTKRKSNKKTLLHYQE